MVTPAAFGRRRLRVAIVVADGCERRQRDGDRALMAPRRHPFETELHRQHVAGERRLVSGGRRAPAIA
jgi:hypothetical protein